jgi:DNA-binding HxlR family transcriptional regulator
VRLRELEAEHLIQRTVIPSTPVQIRYALTQVGVELVTALQPLMDFTLRNIVAATAAPRSGHG